MDSYGKYIQKNKKFELIKQNPDGTKGRFISHFVDKASSYYTISIPKYQDCICTLSPTEEVKLYLYTPDGVYSIESTVIKASGENYQISHPKSIKHSQRREFLRVEKQCRVYVKVHKSNGTLLRLSALTQNICGRGFAILLDTPVGEYDKIETEILLDDVVIETLAEIVYTKPISTPDGVKHSCAFMLISLKDKDVDAIVKECFLFQLQEKKRALRHD